MTVSRRLAGLLGPTLIALSVTEWMNMGAFTDAMGPSFGPHVYLNGTLLFVAGLAMVRAHNLWTRRWPVLITLVAWFAVIGGLGRMAAPLAAQAVGESKTFLYATLMVLLATGVVLTYQGYFRAKV